MTQPPSFPLGPAAPPRWGQPRLALLGVLLLASGCAAPAATDYAALGDPARLGPAPSLAASEMAALHARRNWFVVTQGRDAGRRLQAEVARDAEGRWMVTLLDKRRSYPALDEAGDLLAAREDDFEEQVKVLYDPPLRVPAALEMGKPFEDRTHLEIRGLADGSLRESGTCRYRVELLGRQTVDTPAGRVEAVIVRQQRWLSLGKASVVATITNAHVPGQGLVASRLERTVRPLGLFGITSVEEMRLAPAGPAEGGQVGRAGGR